MATIYKRGTVWYVDYRVEGKRIRKKVGRSKKIAEIALKDIEVKLAKNEIGITQEKKLLSEFFKEYLDFAKTNLAPLSFTRYREIINHFQSFLSNYPKIKYLSQLNPSLLEKYKTFRRETMISKNGYPIEKLKKKSKVIQKGVKANTINMEITTLKTLMNVAIKWKYLKENPFKEVKEIKVSDAKPPRFLTKEEVNILLKNADSNFYPILMTFLYTGLRKNELINLEWSDIDFQRRKIKVRKKGYWNPKGTERDIPINKKLFEALKELKSKSDSRYVFGKGDKKCSNKLRERLMVLTKKCGLPDVTKLHSLRHTFASHLVMSGVDLATVQKILGHTDIETTMIYAHLVPDHLVQAVERLEY